jgi:ubiquitin-like modifier-activating enzyme ATG7
LVFNALHVDTKHYFIVKLTGDAAEVHPIDDPLLTSSDLIIIGFLDPSAAPENPSWPLRNLLAYLLALCPSHTACLPVLCWRDGEMPAPGKAWKSRFCVVSHPGSTDPTAKPTVLGWERHPTTYKSARMADLAPMMDPIRYRRFVIRWFAS